MKFNHLSTRIKVFMIAVCIIVIGQVVYSIYNVRSFQNSYVETLQLKCQKLGGFLKDDVEYVLNLNIPLDKLVKLEDTLNETLKAIPELTFIQITDMDRWVLYYADHQTVERVPKHTRRSHLLRKPDAQLARIGLTDEITDTTLPVFHQRKNLQVGYIDMRLSPELIARQSWQILLDMITVILTSLLITFELLTFFVSFSISNPLSDIVDDVNISVRTLSPLSGKIFLFMSDLREAIERFNDYVSRLSKILGPHLSAQQYYPEIEKKSVEIIEKQSGEIASILPNLQDSRQSPLKKALKCTQNELGKLKQRITDFSSSLTGQPFTPQIKGSDGREDEDRHLPYSYIRPLIFLFIMADGFCASFFPMFVDTLYEPIFGLSREVVMGLPISLFMFFLAVSMPMTGSFADAKGWYRPLVIGILLNASGLILTSLSQNIYQLLIFRSVTAIGFGMTSMASQQFVIDNTSSSGRAMGMSAFLAAYFGGDICGTVVGGMLADRIGYRSVFLVSGIIAVFSLICCIMIFYEKNKEQPLHRSAQPKSLNLFPFKDLFRVFKDKFFLFIVLFQAIPAKLILIGFLCYFVPVYLKSLNTIQSTIGRVFMCYAVMLVFAVPIFSKFFDKEDHRYYYVLTGGLITGLSMLCFLFVKGFGATLMMVILLGIAHTFSTSSQVSLISETKIIKELGPGTGMGLFRFWERMGTILGPIVVGFLTSRMAYENVVVVLGCISIGCSLIYGLFLAVFLRRQKNGGQIR